jgi:hypothetical protein
MEAYIAYAVLGFTVASHTLAYAAQLLKDFKKDQPGWLNTVTTIVGKGLDLLNGAKAPKA